MFHIALYQPEIPPNTGNVIRLCANAGAVLHLIHPLGFHPDDKKLKRAGLDYHDWATIQHHVDYATFLHDVGIHKRLFALSTHGHRCYTDVVFQPGDVFLFGPETRGLPQTLLASLEAPQILRIPMCSHSRSINLSNAVSIVLYEAWRQQDFCGGLR